MKAEGRMRCGAQTSCIAPGEVSNSNLSTINSQLFLHRVVVQRRRIDAATFPAQNCPVTKPRQMERRSPDRPGFGFGEKQNDDYYLTKTNLRSYGYGLSRKPLIFKPVKRPTERAQVGAAWRVRLTGA
jgi:hypothetical protein